MSLAWELPGGWCCKREPSKFRAALDPACSIRNAAFETVVVHRTGCSFAGRLSRRRSSKKIYGHNQHSSTILPWSTAVGPATSAVKHCPGGDPLVGNDVGTAPFTFALRVGDAERTFLAQDPHTARWRPCRDQRNADRCKYLHGAVAINRIRISHVRLWRDIVDRSRRCSRRP